jgi:ABC-type cobalamin/Fe3+-siderophores transport system ATPase subunit
MPAFEVEHLRFGYTRTPILADMSFAVGEGAFFAIAGPNGAGKTTLMRLLAGLLKPHDGTIKLNGKKINSYAPKLLARQIAVVCQEYVPVFDFTVLEMVTMVRLNRHDFVLFEDADDRHIVADALEQTEIVHLAGRRLNELSGGERQRVFIARALAQNTPILLLDEPTNHLDMKHQIRIFDLLKKLQVEQQKTILAVTHDLNIACQYCDHAMLLSGGEMTTGSPADIFTAERIKAVFEVDGFQGSIRNKPFFIPLGRGDTGGIAPQ